MSNLSALFALLLSLLFLLCALMQCSAQSSLPKAQTDSLWAVWSNPKEADTSRLKAINRIAVKGYLNSQPDSAVYFAQLQYDFAESKGLKKQMASALRTQGTVWERKNEHHKALASLSMELKLRKQINDLNGAATTLNSIGVILSDQGNFSEAIVKLYESMDIRRRIDDKAGVANVLMGIGVIHMSLKETDIAMPLFLEGLDIFESLGNEAGAAMMMVNIGSGYMGVKQFEQALAYYHKSNDVFVKLGLLNYATYSLNGIADVYEKTQQYRSALNYYFKALHILKSENDESSLALTLNGIGGTYRYLGIHDSAVVYTSKAYEWAKKTGDINRMMEAAEVLHESYKALHLPAKALEMHEVYVAMRDSINSEENQKEVMRQQFQYDYEKKEAVAQAEQDKKDAIAAQVLQRQKLVRNGFMGGFTVVLLFAGVVLTQRNRISKEKARSEKLLLNILPSEVAEELKAKGSADARLIEDVTVLFTDFKGFTQLSEGLSPKALVADLNECFSAFDHICEKYGIEKIKTIGDAYMAAGGLPTPNTTHPTDTVKAALEMAAFVAEGRAHKLAAGLPFFEVRIGIHTGPVVAGIVGVKKFQYDIWGDTVNTASRMESSGEVGRVNISESTYQLVKDKFTCEYRGEIEAKGKGKMGMYFVDNC